MRTGWWARWLVGVLGVTFVLAAHGPVVMAAPPAEGQVCAIAGDKVASPVRVLLGETVQIRLTLDPLCPPAVYRKSDMVLVIDRSLSMAEASKLTGAKAAARAFVNTTDLGLHRIGVVSFASDVFVSPIGLSQDKAQILRAIDDIEIRPGTNIAAALDAAQNLLATGGRAEALPVIILLSDGSPNAPSPDPRTAAVTSANFAKLAGTQIFSVGFGSDTDEQLMQSVATSPAYYYYAPDNEEHRGHLRGDRRRRGHVGRPRRDPRRRSDRRRGARGRLAVAGRRGGRSARDVALAHAP